MTKTPKVNQLQLKLLALALMTLDHIGGVMGRDNLGTLYQPLRAVGRIAFPIYCFLLVEGFFHTRSLQKYLGRLLLAACLSEVPFCLGLYRRFPASRSNVMLTLVLGLMTVAVLDRGKTIFDSGEGDSLLRQSLFQMAVVSVGMGAAFLLRTDYRGGGVLLIVLFYLFRGQLWAQLATMAPVMLVFYRPSELYALLALLPIALYSGEQGPRLKSRGAQWFFYLYYPLHLTVLVLLRSAVLHTPVTVFGKVV
jgi:hypothetical protein